MKFILLFFIIFNAHAETFLISGDTYDFFLEKDVLVSGCKINQCEARKWLNSSFPSLPNLTPYRSSMGSLACKTIPAALTVFGKHSNGDRRAFCILKDGSLIELNSFSKKLEAK
jgi:hypothetical protein